MTERELVQEVLDLLLGDEKEVYEKMDELSDKFRREFDELTTKRAKIAYSIRDCKERQEELKKQEEC